jgi:hypothetical protein
MYPASGTVYNTNTLQEVTRLVDDRGRYVYSEKMMEVRFKDGKVVQIGDQWCNGQVGMEEYAVKRQGSRCMVAGHLVITRRANHGVIKTIGRHQSRSDGAIRRFADSGRGRSGERQLAPCRNPLSSSVLTANASGLFAPAGMTGSRRTSGQSPSGCSSAARLTAC